MNDTVLVALGSLIIRILTVTYMVLCSALVPRFDTSGRILLSQRKSAGSDQSYVFDPLASWDVVHFAGIATEGYTLEQQHAFMPGISFVMHASGRLIGFLGGQTSSSPFDNVIGGALVANVACVISSVMLWRLTMTLTKSRAFSMATAIAHMLALAPSTLSVAYTEALFAMFSFAGLLALAKERHLLAAGAMACGTCFRATGILNGGFFVWSMLQMRPKERTISAMTKLVLCTGIVIAPFVAFQVYGREQYCSDRSLPERRWCRNSPLLPYSFVQAEYWDVGFLKYYTVQQSPNFLLAAPLLALSFASCVVYLQHHRSVLWKLITRQFTDSSKILDASATRPRPFLNDNMLPHVLQHAAISCLLLFASHVQISLRQAVTHPVIFWYIADLLVRPDETPPQDGGPAGSRATTSKGEGVWRRDTSPQRGKLWIKYAACMGVASVALWAGFYPPA